MAQAAAPSSKVPPDMSDIRCSLPLVLLLAPLAAQEPRTRGYEVTDLLPAQEQFERPLFLDHHAADPLVYYVVEQNGKVFRVPRDGSEAGRQLFLDWTRPTLGPKKGGHNEEGLLGFALDPEYDKNGQFYIYYSHQSGTREVQRRGRTRRLITRESVISRFGTRLVDGQRVAVADSEEKLMRFDQPFGNHNGGTICFGPDRMLYVAVGDGGAANDPYKHGQNLETLLGTVLRIDVRGKHEKGYSVPEDNPFVDKGKARGEIFAYGLRNPWRISFDKETGELWCGDVGQNRYEEVDRLVKGGNYGWNHMEGKHPFPAKARRDPSKYLAPVTEYPRSDGISITGGYVYRGQELPELRGYYIYADYVTGRIWGVKEDRKGGDHKVAYLVRRGGNVASFGELPDGELVALRYDTGRIHKLVRRGGDK